MSEILEHQTATLNSVTINTTSILNGLIPKLLSVPLLSPDRVNALLLAAAIPGDIITFTTKSAGVKLAMEDVVKEEILETNALVQNASDLAQSVFVEIQDLVSNSSNTNSAHCGDEALKSVREAVMTMKSTISACIQEDREQIDTFFTTVVKEFGWVVERSVSDKWFASVAEIRSFITDGVLKKYPEMVLTVLYSIRGCIGALEEVRILAAPIVPAYIQCKAS